MNTLRRAASVAAIALAFALLAAAPAAAAQPSRTVYPSAPVSHYPAGTGCDFDVTAYKLPSAHTTEIDFSNGTVVFETHSMHRRIVNDATGAEYDQNIESHERDTFDGDLIRGTINGQFIWQFYPGDMGPDGAILDHLLALDIVGRATYVVEGNTGVTLAISIVGQTTDICAAIS
jgi:hypothetical protein